jgi:hypothetical protein
LYQVLSQICQNQHQLCVSGLSLRVFKYYFQRYFSYIVEVCFLAKPFSTFGPRESHITERTTCHKMFKTPAKKIIVKCNWHDMYFTVALTYMYCSSMKANKFDINWKRQGFHQFFVNYVHNYIPPFFFGFLMSSILYFYKP